MFRNHNLGDGVIFLKMRMMKISLCPIYIGKLLLEPSIEPPEGSTQLLLYLQQFPHLFQLLPLRF